MIQDPIEHSEVFEAYGSPVARGILLYGPPGCGKTMLAKAAASQSNANFISIKGPQLLSKWFGESEENVRGIFQKARDAAPCLICFDEIDAIAKSRSVQSGDSVSKASDRVLTQLLMEMDGVSSRRIEMVFVIGTTNRPEVLDTAIIRPGRLANCAERAQILSNLLKPIRSG